MPRRKAPSPAAHLSAGPAAPAQLRVKSNPTLHLPWHLWRWSSPRSCWDLLHKTICFNDLTDFYAIFYTFTVNSKTLLGFFSKRFVNYTSAAQTLSQSSSASPCCVISPQILTMYKGYCNFLNSFLLNYMHIVLNVSF